MIQTMCGVTLVVIEAIIWSNQSERSKILGTNQHRAFSPCDHDDVSYAHIWASCSRDPMGKRTRTHKRLIHILHIVLMTA